MVVEDCSGQVQQVVTRARCPHLAAFDFAAPQPAHQIIQGTLTQLLDLDMTEFVP